jgi:hypothetical protein
MSQPAPTTKPIPLAEYDAVIHACNQYISSLAKADRDELEKAFHDDATMTGYFLDGTLFKGSHRGLHAYYDAHGPAGDKLKARCDVLAITPTTAVVRIDMDGTPDNPYTDFHTLLKVDGQWKIMHKVFHAYKAE